MCDLATGLVALSLASGGYSAVTQSNIAKQNAAFARYEAEQTKEIGRFNEARAADKMDRLIARQRAQIATRGVRLDSASALDLGEEAAGEKFTEVQSQRFNTSVRVQSKLNEARQSDYAAQVALTGGLLGAGTKALTQSLELWPELQGA